MTQDVRSGSGDLAPGEQVAGYEIQGPIGRGGMAVVYRALDLRLGRTVALKVLAPELGEDEAFRQRFIRESRAAAGVDHPHIIPVFEAGESAGVLFIAMRYVSGGDVRSLIEAEGTLRPGRAAEITSQVASALDAAHARGLVHRDVKPGNILLGEASSGHDHVYLSDFGLSKHSLTTSTLTSTGQFLGTLDYVSPEQIQGHPVDGRADQYALACAVVEMLTGGPPFQATDTMALMWAQLQSAPPRLADRRPDLPPVLDQVIGRALAKSPGSRYPSCGAFAEALAAGCAAPDLMGPPTARSDPVRPAVADDPWPRPSPRDRRVADWLAPADSRAGEALTTDRGWGERSAAATGKPVPPIRIAPSAEPELARNFLTPGTPGAQSWPSQPPLSAPGYQQSARQPPPNWVRPGRGRPPRHTGRNVTIALLVALFVAGVVAAVVYRLAHRTDVATPPPAATTTTTITVPPPTADPATIVREYFDAINHQRYFVAWQLTAKKQPEPKFAAGFAGTERDVLTIESVNGDVVTARLAAYQTSGLVKHYEGSYTVTNGIISSAKVVQTG